MIVTDVADLQERETQTIILIFIKTQNEKDA